MKKFIILTSMLFLVACQAIPKNALVMTPQTLQDRQIQTRIFETTDKEAMLIAATGVLQDLGFAIDETDVELGVIVGQKQRDAISGSQVAGAFVMAALTGVAMPIDTTQTIRVSMVMRENSVNKKNKDPNKHELTNQEVEKVKKFVRNTVYEKLIKYQTTDKSKQIAKLASEKLADDLTNTLERVIKIYSGDGESVVRVTFQRVIYNSQGNISRAEQIKDTEIYQAFYEKLSKSIFLEANEI